MDFAGRLADRCDSEAELQDDPDRAGELRQMAANLRHSPSKPVETFWQALQSVWLLHMIFHSTMNGNATGRMDQYVWPYLHADLEAGRITRMGAEGLFHDGHHLEVGYDRPGRVLADHIP